jgi:SAM-dependent methyltransferase
MSEQRELAFHEDLYGGFAQQHFAKAAVVEFRRHLVRRIIQATGADGASQVLSLGCGIGDTELLLAGQVGGITGIDLSPRAIEQAGRDAAAQGIKNAQFAAGSWKDFGPGGRRFDAIIAVFFLHHLGNDDLAAIASRVAGWLKPGGCFYSLDPSRRRLSGAIGELLFPALMRRHQTPDEHPLLPQEAAAPFKAVNLNVQTRWYDFVSTPLAGLLPSWRAGYRAARMIDEILIRTPLLRSVSSNFEIVARL